MKLCLCVSSPELPGKEVKQEDEGVLSSAADEDADTTLTAVSTPPAKRLTTTTQSTGEQSHPQTFFLIHPYYICIEDEKNNCVLLVT